MPFKIQHQVAATVKPDCESVELPLVCSLRHTTHVVWQEMPAREVAQEAQGTPPAAAGGQGTASGAATRWQNGSHLIKLSRDSMFGKVPASH